MAIINDVLRQVVADVPGWTSFDDLLALFAMAMSSPAGEFVDVGAFCGRSSIAMGLAARERGNQVFALDLWPKQNDWVMDQTGWFYNVQVNGKDRPGCFSRIWNEPFTDVILPIYNSFSNLQEAFEHYTRIYGVRDHVIPMRMNSWDLRNDPVRFQFVKEKCSLCFIDADHAENMVVTDIANCMAFLKDGGTLAVDDYGGVYYGVTKAVDSVVRKLACFQGFTQVTRKMAIARYDSRATSEDNSAGR